MHIPLVQEVIKSEMEEKDSGVVDNQSINQAD